MSTPKQKAGEPMTPNPQPAAMTEARQEDAKRIAKIVEIHYPPAAAVIKNLLAELSRLREERDRKLPAVEEVAERVHEAWMEGKRSVGITTRLSTSGEELMVPYRDLSDEAKELDRQTVRAVYAALAAATPHAGEKEKT